MDEQLKKYVKENLHKGYSAAEIAERLRQGGYDDEEIQDALAAEAHMHKHTARVLLVSAGFVALLILGIMFYLFVLSPTGVEKPQVEKPAFLPVEERAIAESTRAEKRVPIDQTLVSEQMLIQEHVSIPEAAQQVEEQVRQEIVEAPQAIDEAHLMYLLTELGAYKLHKNPFTGALPEIEVIITDTGQVFDALVQYNEVFVIPGSANSPDARVSIDRYAVVQLASAENSDEFKKRAEALYDERDQRGYTGEFIAGKTDLLLKGYMALCDEAKEFESPTGSITWDVELAGSQIIGAFIIIVVLWGALILRMALHR